MSFNRTQQVALAIAPKFSGILSILGSGWIVIEVLTQKRKRHNVYNRLLCAMSITDILTATWQFASTWPIPEGTDGVAFASGNLTSCVVQGFFIQFGMGTPVYNSCLAVYYLLVVRYGLSEYRLKYIEPIFHTIAISYALGTSFAGVGLDLYNNANLWCWIAPYPTDCQDSRNYGETNCIRGDNAWIYRWAFYFAPLWFMILFVTLVMISVYMSIRSREIKAIKNNAPGNRRSSFMVKPKARRHIGPRSSFIRKYVHTAKESRHLIIPKDMASDFAETSQSFKAIIGGGETSQSFKAIIGGGETSQRCKPIIGGGGTMGGGIQPSWSNKSLKSSASFDNNKSNTRLGDAERVLSTLESFPTAQQQNLEANHFGSRAVFWQSVFYCVAFYATFTFATINRLLQQITGNTYFVVILLHSIFIPLQGFFNALVYRYAFYFRLKHRNPHMNGWELMLATWRWSFLGPLEKTTKESKSNGSGVTSKKITQRIASVTRVNSGSVGGSSALEKRRPKQQQQRPERLSRMAEINEEGSDTGSYLNDQDLQNVTAIADDVYDVGGYGDGPSDNDIYDVMSDLMVAYSDFPNVLADDAVMISTNFPSMVVANDHDESIESNQLQVGGDATTTIPMTTTDIQPEVGVDANVSTPMTTDEPEDDIG